MNEIEHWELPDSYVHACTPLDARRPIRSITGSLSLHDYRKLLSADPVDHASGKLKRKTAALHLNCPSVLPPSSVSVASSPPPLSPSYSHSIISQRSEEPEIGEAQPVHVQPQSPRVTVVSENGTRVRPNNRKRLNTFREKLQKNARAQAEAKARARSQQSDSMLAHTQAVPTVSHGGACFEILNPRKSLDLARIVSYIEDVDGCSMLSDNRDSAFSLEQGLDRVSLSQFTDASLPSFYSTNSLYNSLQPDCSTPKPQTTDIPSSSPGIHDHVRSLSDFPYNPHFSHWSHSVQDEPTSHIDLIQDTDADTDGDTNADNDDYQTNHSFRYRGASTSQTTTPSTETNPPPLSHTETDSRPVSSSQQTFSEESEIGEPGSPVYANGEWAQVNERDRGIFYEIEQDFHTPQETPLATPINSPLYSPFDSTSTSAYPYPKPPPFHHHHNHYSTPPNYPQHRTPTPTPTPPRIHTHTIPST
ncbi:hypothetical protein N7499_010441 [Penicillium canescens]|nr:hypothetical protein N7499_010441 [Penicillium canescens]